MTSKPTKRRRIDLSTQVFIGLGLGISTGIFFGEEVAFLKIGGDAFIAALQITVIPYVVIALITSLGKLTIDDIKSLSMKAGAILLALWAIGLVIVMLTPLALPDWPSASFFSTTQIEEPTPVDFLRLYIPSNFFYALANALVPAIVVFAVLFGVALARVSNKGTVLDLLSAVGDTLMAITGFVAKLSPYGVFAITGSAAGTIDVGDLGRLQVYILLHLAIALILALWVLPGMITTMTPFSYGAILRTFRAPLITAFATGSALIVLPMLAVQGKKLIGETDEYSDQPSEREESSVDILIPAAYPFPSLGTVLALMFVIFAGWYVGSAVAFGDFPVMMAAGLASLFGGTVLALPFLLDLLRLPADLFGVFVTVDVIGSRFGTLLAVMHYIAIAMIGTYALDGRLRLRLVPLLRFAVISTVMVAGTLIGIRAFYTHVYVQPYVQDQILAGLSLIESPQPHTVYREAPEEILRETGAAISFDRFEESGTLRVCYFGASYPRSYFNRSGELVGFDIEMMHRFARYLGVEIEFLPVGTVEEVVQRLNSPYCDVLAMSVPIAPQLTRHAAATSPVLNSPLGVLVRDHRRHAFQKWGDIQKMEGLRVLVASDAVSQRLLAHWLPNATPISIDTVEELEEVLASGAADADAGLVLAEVGSAWTLKYPAFSVVVPTPTVFVPMGYAVARGDKDFLLYFNTWLLNAQGAGVIDRLYRYWMLGQVQEAQPPRWSVIRNVLGWVD